MLRWFPEPDLARGGIARLTLPERHWRSPPGLGGRAARATHRRSLPQPRIARRVGAQTMLRWFPEPNLPATASRLTLPERHWRSPPGLGG
ncbi:MAG TPA: hypothetical protein VHC18_12465 [Amycolatopsis sp.]|nr:hypothetical protein [Amycolatopsis sp.]